MIDVKDLLERPDVYRKNCLTRNINLPFDEIIACIKERRKLRREIDDIRAMINISSKVRPNDEIRAQIRERGELLRILESKEKEVAKKESEFLFMIPNLNHASVPISNDPNTEVIVREVGDKPVFKFEPLDHQSLGEKMGIIDMESGIKVSGTRFWYLRGDLVNLQMSLIVHVLGMAQERGFIPALPPVLVKENAMLGTGFLPADEKELYRVNQLTDNLFLVGTSEVPLVGAYQDQILTLPPGKPLRVVGYSSCFRREAGAAGKDTRGILRGHQFDKIELVVVCHPDDGDAQHLAILDLEESILQSLKIPYRVRDIVSSDLGNPAARKFDIEAWIPSQKTYREVTSTSHCTDFQARRLGIRFKSNVDDKPALAHTLNGTACALGRTIIAIMENFQEEDGKIRVPEILLRYGMLKEYLRPLV